MVFPFTRQPKFGDAGKAPIWKTPVKRSFRVLLLRRRADGALTAIAGYGKVTKENGREHIEGIMETKEKLRLPFPPYESVIPSPRGDVVIYYEPESEIYYPIVSAKAASELSEGEWAVLEPKADFPAKDEYIRAREDAEKMWAKKNFIEKWLPVITLGAIVAVSVIMVLMLFKGFTDAVAPLKEIATQVAAASETLAEAVKVARGVAGAAP